MKYYATLKKEGNLAICDNMNLEDTIMLSEITRHRKINATWLHAYVDSEIVKLIEAESRMVVARSWGLEMRDVG